MAEDDIESYWEEIRPRRVPEPPRDMSQYAKQVRERSELTDAERDLTDLWERPPPLTTPNPPVVLVGPQRTPEQVAAWQQALEDTQQVLRRREEGLQAGVERGLALAPIRQALITELGREPTLQETQDAYNTLQQYATVPETQEELEAEVHRGDRVPERDRRRIEYARLAFEEGLPGSPDQAMIEIPQGLRSVNQRLQEVLGRDPNMREVLAGIQRERELDRPLSVTEINDLLRELSDLELREHSSSSERFLAVICRRLFQELGRSPTSNELREAFLAQGGTAEQMMEGIRQALRNRSASSPTEPADPSVLGRQPLASYFPSWTAPGSSEFFDRQAEYNRLAVAAGLPEGSITVERADPDLVRIAEQVRNIFQNGHYDPLSHSAPPRAADPDYNTRDGNALSNLTDALGALGFPPESISIERSIEGGTSLTIHMPMSMQTQLTGPGHSSVTFTLG